MGAFTFKISLTLLASCIVYISNLCGQATDTTSQTEKKPSFNLQLNGGYNTLDLGDVETFYNNILQFYKNNDISIPTQRSYPGNLLLGIEAKHVNPSSVNLGAGATYTWTSAYSLYGDNTGELDITSRVKLLVIQGIIQKDLHGNSKLYPFVEIRGGLVLGWLEYVEEIKFTAIPELNTSTTLKANGKGLDIEGYIGGKYSVNSFLFSTMAGYRYAKVSKPSSKINGESSGKLPFDINLSGLVFMIGIGRLL